MSHERMKIHFKRGKDQLLTMYKRNAGVSAETICWSMASDTALRLYKTVTHKAKKRIGEQGVNEIFRHSVAIDSKRMLVMTRGGKGKKDRQSLLSKSTLEDL